MLLAFFQTLHPAFLDGCSRLRILGCFPPQVPLPQRYLTGLSQRAMSSFFPTLNALHIERSSRRRCLNRGETMKSRPLNDGTVCFSVRLTQFFCRLMIWTFIPLWARIQHLHQIHPTYALARLHCSAVTDTASSKFLFFVAFLTFHFLGLAFRFLVITSSLWRSTRCGRRRGTFFDRRSRW